jgi:hypothetical protein
MTGRCGSSTVAGIFHAHGVWCGTKQKPDENNPRGYFENRKLKEGLRAWAGFDFTGPIPEFKPGWRKEVEGIIKADGYKNGPWMYKHGAFFHKLWQEFNPAIVKVQRNTADVFKSYKECGFLKKYTDKELIYIIDRQKEIMDHLPGVTINAELLFERNYKELEIAFGYCGLDFEITKANEYMDG